MNKTIGLQLIAYSLLLAGLSYFVHHLAPEFARITLIWGLAGGGLCFLWGLLAVLGNPRKAFSILTLIPLGYVLLGQAIMNWRAHTLAVTQLRVAVLIIAALFVLTLLMLMRIAYAGMAMGTQPLISTKEAVGHSKQK